MKDLKSIVDSLTGLTSNYDYIRSDLSSNDVVRAIWWADDGYDDCDKAYDDLKDKYDVIKYDRTFCLPPDFVSASGIDHNVLSDLKGNRADGLLKISDLLGKLRNLGSFYSDLSNYLKFINHINVDTKDVKICKLDSVLAYDSAFVLTPADLLRVIPAKIDPFNDPASIKFIKDFTVLRSDKLVKSISSDYALRVANNFNYYNSNYVPKDGPGPPDA